MKFTAFLIKKFILLKINIRGFLTCKVSSYISIECFDVLKKSQAFSVLIMKIFMTIVT